MRIYVIAMVIAYVQVAKNVFGHHYLISPQQICGVCWRNCDTNMMVFNVDGSVLTNLGKAGFGGLMWNNNDDF